jgi:hypothetical protein
MEPIALCGFIIVVFGLWVEFEPTVKAVVKMIRNRKFFRDVFANSAVQNPVYVSRMPICLAKPFNY